MPSLLPVATIWETGGSTRIDMGGVEAVRVLSPLTIRRVEGDGPARIEIGPSGSWGALPTMRQPGDESVTSRPTILACAPLTTSTRIERVDLLPEGALAADDANYLIATLRIVLDGVGVGDALAVRTTQTYDATFRPNATGDWIVARAAIAITLAMTLPAGHSLVVLWTAHGTPPVLPDGVWRLS